LASVDPAGERPGLGPSAPEGSSGARLAVIDFLRGVAILAMVIYHAAFDLYADRLIAVDVVSDPGWKLLARATASTFLVLVGIGLVLSTRHGFRRDRYLRRLGFIAGGAVLVSIATWWFDPATFVFFGILHEIAVASVLALPFLWVPSWFTALIAAGVIALPFWFADPLFDAPPLWWVGLSTNPPETLDYVPVLPWFGAVLAGIVVGRLVVRRGGRLWQWQPHNPVAGALMGLGRWSLPIYLVHQPLIVGALSLAMMVLPPPGKDFVRQTFVGQCVSGCSGNSGLGSTAACTALCGCMFDDLYGTDLFKAKSLADLTPAQRDRWNAIVASCQPVGN
jgi:uncharacterized membrane protein